MITPSDVHERDVPPSAAGTDFDITPEMMEAGCLELASYNPENDQLETIVEMIFTAMIQAKLSTSMRVREF